MQYTVDLGIPVPSEYADEICDRLAYAHSDIEKIEVEPSDSRHLIIFATPTLDISALQPVLAGAAKEMLKASFEGIHVVIRDRRDKTQPPAVNAFDELADRGWIVKTAMGAYAKTGPAFRLLKKLDSVFRGISLEAGAQEMEFSTFMDVEVLRKAGHFNAFPQHITFANHLSEDLEFLKGISEEANRDGGSVDKAMEGNFVNSGACLAPAVCYNFYHCLSGQTVDTMKIAAAANTCYRFESGRMEGLSRMWEFTMRELIFVGAANEVLAAREKAIEAVWRLAERWNLHAWVENANDPFFIGEFSSRAAFQRNREMKYELRLSIAGDYSVAAASFNFHSTKFGHNFKITLPNGRPACSGCAAWGEERWMVALFSQFGFDPKDWPEDLANEVWNENDLKPKLLYSNWK